MHSTSCEADRDAVRDLRRGGILFSPGASTGTWRVVSGALRLDHEHAGVSRFVRLATAGDCVGEETLVGGAHASSACAVVPSRVRRLDPESREGALAADVLLRQHERFLALLRLRTGTTSDRLRCLFAMLAGDAGRAYDTFACPMPTLADLAAIVDAAPETVSRVLGDLGREGVLHERRRAGVLVDGERLRLPSRFAAGRPDATDRPAPAALRRVPRSRAAQSGDLAAAGAR